MSGNEWSLAIVRRKRLSSLVHWGCGRTDVQSAGSGQCHENNGRRQHELQYCVGMWRSKTVRLASFVTCCHYTKVFVRFSDFHVRECCDCCEHNGCGRPAALTTTAVPQRKPVLLVPSQNLSSRAPLPYCPQWFLSDILAYTFCWCLSFFHYTWVK